jgi:hypothetical protein
MLLEVKHDRFCLVELVCSIVACDPRPDRGGGKCFQLDREDDWNGKGWWISQRKERALREQGRGSLKPINDSS